MKGEADNCIKSKQYSGRAQILFHPPSRKEKTGQSVYYILENKQILTIFSWLSAEYLYDDFVTVAFQSTLYLSHQEVFKYNKNWLKVKLKTLLCYSS